MSEALQLTAENYRDKAEEIRRFASRARTASVTIDLFEIAERFERMADHLERRMIAGQELEPEPDGSAPFAIQATNLIRPARLRA